MLPHRNILGVVSFEMLPEASLLAVPLATGGNTLQHMQSRQCAPMAEDEVRSLFTQLLRGMEHMHKAGVVHHDIKCEKFSAGIDGRSRPVTSDCRLWIRWS